MPGNTEENSRWKGKHQKWPKDGGEQGTGSDSKLSLLCCQQGAEDDNGENGVVLRCQAEGVGFNLEGN